MKVKVMLAALAVPLLCGCSGLLYKEPLDGPRARVRISTNVDAVTVVHAYPDRACKGQEAEWMRLKKGLLLSGEGKRLGMPLWEHHENGTKEVYVAADTSPTFMFSATARHYTREITCGVVVTQAFAAGRDYELDYRWFPDRCTVTVNALEHTGDGYRRRVLAVADNHATPEAASCMERFKANRW